MLPPDCMQKEYEQIVRTPFVFAVGKTCFMEGTAFRKAFCFAISLLRADGFDDFHRLGENVIGDIERGEKADLILGGQT